MYPHKNIYKYDDWKRSEHMAVRKTVGWYYFTHMLLEISGEDVVPFLERIFPKDVSSIAVGADRYTVMLDETGNIIDDVVIMRKEETRFWISSLFVHYMIPWFDKNKGNYHVEYNDITRQWEMYSVQGPKSLDVINDLVKKPVNDLGFFRFCDNEIDGIPVIINRAGYTGEKFGYEIYMLAEYSDAVEEKLRASAQKFEGKQVTEFQVMAWTLPAEAGFYYMRDLRYTNPYEAGLEKGFNYNKEFIGKEALLKIQKEGHSREILGFTLSEPDYINITSEHMGGHGEPVEYNGEEIGRVRKLVYSYVKEECIGLIIVTKGIVKPGDAITIHGYNALVTAPRFL